MRFQAPYRPPVRFFGGTRLVFFFTGISSAFLANSRLAGPVLSIDSSVWFFFFKLPGPYFGLFLRRRRVRVGPDEVSKCCTATKMTEKNLKMFIFIFGRRAADGNDSIGSLVDLIPFFSSTRLLPSCTEFFFVFNDVERVRLFF